MCRMAGYQKALRPGCKNKSGIQRFPGTPPECHTTIFLYAFSMLKYQKKDCESGISKKIIGITINGSGIRDTARILNISKGTVINTLNKQEYKLISVNPDFCPTDK